MSLRLVLRAAHRRAQPVIDPHFIAHRTLRRALAPRLVNATGLILDLGCGYQPYRGLMPKAGRYVAFDRPGATRMDVGGDAQRLPFRSGVADHVLCTQVIEHVPEPASVLGEIARVLKPGGRLVLTAPLTWGLHGEPYDYYRYTPYSLGRLAEQSGLDVVEIEPTCGLWATLAQRVVDTIISTYAKDRSVATVTLLSALLVPVQWAGYGLDRLIGPRGDTLDYVLVARKPGDLRT